MWLQRLQAQGLRCFLQCDIDFAPGINILCGDNGAGKTSILEGISVLSCGKSFRRAQLNHIIHQHCEDLILFGGVVYRDRQLTLGVKLSHNGRELRVNRETVSKWSDLAKHLPVLDIHPESYLLITGGPVERRRFLNWGVFHVEPEFANYWTGYEKALKQRNKCLKIRAIDQARHWNQYLASRGDKISVMLEDYVQQLIPYINNVTRLFRKDAEISYKYFKGWDKNASLEQKLHDELNIQDVAFATQYGPHRGDLQISWQHKPFAKTSSRGQQKVLSLALKLAQAQLLRERYGKSSIYLIDELPAELDKKSRQTALNLLRDLNAQVIISAVSKESVDMSLSETQWFHVERGSIQAVL